MALTNKEGNIYIYEEVTYGGLSNRRRMILPYESPAPLSSRTD